MQKILKRTRSGLSAVATAGRRACLAALLASSVSIAGGTATAQTNLSTVQPAMATNLSEAALNSESTNMSLMDTHDSYMMPGGLPMTSSIVQPGLVSPMVAQGGSYFDSGAANCNPCVTAGCDVSWYLNYEALWLRREGDDRFTLTRFARLPKFDYELGEFGGRVTAGRLFDCHNGVEAVYTGPYEWNRQVARNVVGNVDSVFVPSGGYDATTINAFNDADRHVQAWQARLNSYEVNRTWWTWDVVQTLVGLRYVDYQEDYSLSTTRAGVGEGFLLENIRNRAVGPQIGGQLFRPASLRTSYGVRGKAAALANFNSGNTFMTNAGNLVLDAGDNSVDFAGLIEMGAFVNYQVVPSVRLTAGYEFWYLPQFATVPEQGLSRINPGTGTSISNEDDLFLHGGSVGVQILY